MEWAYLRGYQLRECNGWEYRPECVHSVVYFFVPEILWKHQYIVRVGPLLHWPVASNKTNRIEEGKNLISVPRFLISLIPICAKDAVNRKECECFSVFLLEKNLHQLVSPGHPSATHATNVSGKCPSHYAFSFLMA
jgi:hypothetical protein